MYSDSLPSDSYLNKWKRTLLSFLICCSFRVIRYIVKRVQVLTKLLTQKYFLVYFLHCFIILPDRLLCKTAFIFHLWYHQLYSGNCVTTVRLHFHSLTQHYMKSFTGSSLFLRVADSCSCPAPCICQHWQKSWGRKLIQARTPWAAGEGTISGPSSCLTVLT